VLRRPAEVSRVLVYLGSVMDSQERMRCFAFTFRGAKSAKLLGNTNASPDSLLEDENQRSRGSHRKACLGRTGSCWKRS
jgi:hypothetical protein